MILIIFVSILKLRLQNHNLYIFLFFYQKKYKFPDYNCCNLIGCSVTTSIRWTCGSYLSKPVWQTRKRCPIQELSCLCLLFGCAETQNPAVSPGSQDTSVPPTVNWCTSLPSQSWQITANLRRSRCTSRHWKNCETVRTSVWV